MKHIKLFENYEDNTDYPLPSNGKPAMPASASIAKNVILKALEIKAAGGNSKPIMLIGAPGIGKTRTIAAAREEAGVEMVHLDLEYMDPSEFMGLPMMQNYVKPLTKNSGMAAVRSSMSAPSWFPMEGSGIIVLDSIDKAGQQIQMAAMKLATNGRIGDNQLPKGWVIVATADSTEFGGSILGDRFTIFKLTRMDLE